MEHSGQVFNINCFPSELLFSTTSPPVFIVLDSSVHMEHAGTQNDVIQVQSAREYYLMPPDSGYEGKAGMHGDSWNTDFTGSKIHATHFPFSTLGELPLLVGLHGTGICAPMV